MSDCPNCAALREQVAAKDAEIVRLGNDCERERVRLAACGVVALANTRESAAQVRPPYDNDDYAYSASLDDVAGAVDEQIEQRERAERAEAENAALQNKLITAQDGWLKAAKERDAEGLANDLRQDAERYREVTKRVQAWPPHMDGTSIWVLEWEGPRAKSFAESVDAAMRDGKG